VVELGRCALSLIVAQAHLYPLNAPWLAWMAVFGFYTLSGYLMTRVLNERYGFRWSGTVAFAVNRVLRLWPAYLVVVALSLGLLGFVPVSPLYKVLRFPETPWEWLVNFTVVGITGFDIRSMANRPVLAPNSWSLSVELVCYALLALGFAGSPRRLWLLAGLGGLALAASTGYCLADRSPPHGPYCFQNRYGVVQAGLIPFAIGGLIYFHGRCLQPIAERHKAALALAFLAAIAAIAVIEPLPYTVAPFVGSLLVGVGLILLLARDASTPATDFFGRASYHLFISHWVVGSFLLVVLGLSRGALLLTLTVACALLLSCLLVPLEHAIERSRRRIAASSEALANAASLRA
jgi:peptidoglycan/LPS O-acetylase OafA/YrhL